MGPKVEEMRDRCWNGVRPFREIDVEKGSVGGVLSDRRAAAWRLSTWRHRR